MTDARIQLVDPNGIISDVGTVPANEMSLELIRADTAAIVFYRFGDYGRNAPVKIFLDPTTKQGIKQIEFSSSSGLVNISNQEIAAALQIPTLLATSLKGRDPQPGPEESWDTYLPQALKDHRMPASTYAEFARARPERVEGGYDSTSSIGEGPGPVQVDGSRIWFGKTFYDGEGMSGVGGVGYFDTLSKAYTFLKIPELVSWSVSTLLLDDQTLWIGLVGHPEGMDYGGGLLRHDLRTGETTKYEVDAVIHRIKRWNGRTYLGTDTGAIVIDPDQIVARYLIEPDLTGKLILVRADH